MKTNVMTVEEAIKNGTYRWNKCENDIEFKGIVPGYMCGWCVEIEKNGNIDYCSCTFTNDYKEIELPEDENGNLLKYNDLGISADLAICNGWEPTGNIVFRGYFKYVHHFGGYVEASNKVMEEVA